MRADAFLQAAETLPFGHLEAITNGGGLVVVAPHPDDETLGCSGLIAAACAHGIAVRLVVVSDGTGSHPNSRLYPPERLRELREAETVAAAAALGLAHDAISFLRLADRYVPSDGPRAEAAAEAILAAVTAVAAGAVCVTWKHDPHCDHQAAAALVELARPRLNGVRVWSYPVWGWTLPADTEVGAAPQGLRLDIAPWVDAKTRAVAAHASQVSDLIDDDPDAFRLDATMLQRFARPFEIFLQTDPRPTPRHEGSVPPTYFAALYEGNPDPWRVATNAYERGKYAATLAALPRLHYAHALEVGCSIGVLTRQLSARCDSILAVDVVAAALDRARQRCVGQPHVAFETACIPRDWPAGTFDLILLSEVLYYLDRNDVEALVDRIRATAHPGCDILLVHWHGLTDHPLSGDEAADLFIRTSADFARVQAQSRTDRYRLDCLRVRASL